MAIAAFHYAVLGQGTNNLCGDDPLGTARRLRRSGDATKMRIALDCFEMGAERQKDPAAYYEAASLAYELGESTRLMRALQASVRIAPHNRFVTLCKG